MKKETVTAGDFFLERLERLLGQHQDAVRRTLTGETHDLGTLQLLERAIKATFYDAGDQGAEVRAWKLIMTFPAWEGWAPE